MNEHNTPDCYCDLFNKPGMPEGAICGPCANNNCVCVPWVNE